MQKYFALHDGMIKNDSYYKEGHWQGHYDSSTSRMGPYLILIDESVKYMYMYLCVVGGAYTGHHC